MTYEKEPRTAAELTAMAEALIEERTKNHEHWSVEITAEGHGRWTWRLAGNVHGSVEDVQAITLALGELRAQYKVVKG